MNTATILTHIRSIVLHTQAEGGTLLRVDREACVRVHACLEQLIGPRYVIVAYGHQEL